MLAILKLLQSLFKTLHSEGPPGQIAGGIALGAALGLTPLMNLHNAIVILLLCVINVSFAAGLLGMALFVPVGFMLDPVFDHLGHWILTDVGALRPLFAWLDAQPVLAFSNLTNTVVLGSVVGWLVLFVPIYLASHYGVIHYRRSLGDWFMKTRIYHALGATRILDVYSWFRP
jgi:uncharacterized protein (TIGR03546 family)